MSKMTKKQVLKEITREGEFENKIIDIARVSRTVKGGRRIRFRVAVVSGDKLGRVGLGVGKANDVQQAVAKATKIAHKKMIKITLYKNTISHQIVQSYGSATVLLKPAPEGTSIIAGGVVRMVAEVSGIKNLVAKILGSDNKINNAKAAILALGNLRPRVQTIIKQTAPKISEDKNDQNSKTSKLKK